ncbi:hypothetical protein C0992_001411 [Termitomyces sp. T32_za158]|nr:hypothetical protein C0992_001411 [Termitomyces sp. T32_za158]
MHNFIMKHDPYDIEDLLDDPDIEDPDPGIFDDSGDLSEGVFEREERDRATAKRDMIAQKMWDQYQQYLLDHPELFEN